MLLILASTSPWRLGLLESVGFAPLAADPDVDEDKIIGKDPIETAKLRAQAKATAVLERLKPDFMTDSVDSAIIVAADQVVYLDDVVFGKPKNKMLWFERLQLLRGQYHGLTTAVSIAVYEKKQPLQRIAFEETTKIQLHADLTDAELWAYVENGEASSCAGGYMVERNGAWLISHIDGDYSNVIGLPIPSLLRIFRGLGFRPNWLNQPVRTIKEM